MKNISIIECPSNLGLKAAIAWREPGVSKLPAWLKQHKFHATIQPKNIYAVSPPPYSLQLHEESGVRNADAIAGYAKKQADILNKVLADKEFAIVIGGDCSILIGNAICLKQKGNYGLFFLDGHTDFMWPPFSQTGGAAGMDLAIVCGYGHDKLANIDNAKPYFDEDKIWCVGNREYEEWYVKLIKDSNIKYIDLKQLRATGIKKVVQDFLQMATDKQLDGFWIHIDLDVLNDDIMPAVDSRQRDGLSYIEFNEMTRLLLTNTAATGIEITILDPDLDPTGKYTALFVQNFCSTFNAALQ